MRSVSSRQSKVGGVQARAAIFALAVAVVGCRGWDSEEPPVHLIHNMDTQEKGKAYRRDTSGIFADGRVMQEPVPGTVAQGQMVTDDAFSEGLGADGQPVRAYPESVKVDDAFRNHGKRRANIYCSPCHGIDGVGNGPVSTRGLLVPAPSWYEDRVKALSPGKIYVAIKDGVNNGNMPPYSHQIPIMDRWAIVAAIRGLQREKDPNQPEEGGPAVTVAVGNKPTAETGAQLYTAKGCNACHTTDGTPRVGPTFKGLYGKKEPTSAGEVTVDDAYIIESMVAPNAKIVQGFPPAMPPFVGSEIEQQSLVLYIKSLK